MKKEINLDFGHILFFQRILFKILFVFDSFRSKLMKIKSTGKEGSLNDFFSLKTKIFFSSYCSNYTKHFSEEKFIYERRERKPVCKSSRKTYQQKNPKFRCTQMYLQYIGARYFKDIILPSS